MALENRIDRVTIKNYRNLADVTVDLASLTVLIGPNGSGKSNFLEVLRFTNEALRYNIGTAIEMRGGFRSLLSTHADKDEAIEITFDFSIGGQTAVYGFAFTGNRHGYKLTREFFTSAKGGKIYEIKDSKVVDSIVEFHGFNFEEVLVLPILAGIGTQDPVTQFLRQMRFYTITPDAIRNSPFTNQSYPLLPDGKNIGAVLRHMKEQPETIWLEQVYDGLAALIPEIEQESTPVTVDEIGQRLAVSIQHTNGDSFDLALESDGTLRALGILTAIYQTPFLPLVGIEEPEMMLYPNRLGVLADCFKEVSAHSQIILTTHSPDLISKFDAASLRLVGVSDGRTQIKPIREADYAAINNDIFGSGDLLRIGALEVE